MKYFSIEEKLFKTEPLFIINCTWQELEKLLQKKYKIDCDLSGIGESAMGTVLHFGEQGLHRIVWLKKFNKKPEHFGSLVHELFHLITRICEDKGITLKPNNQNGETTDEPPAYMIDYFVREFLKNLIR